MKAYGAVPDDGGDDTAAFAAAIGAAPASGAEIYVPAGTYLLSAPLRIDDRRLALRGEGQRVSVLRWDRATDGLVYTSTGFGNTLTVTGLSITTSQVGGVGIRAAWPAIPRGQGVAYYGLATAILHNVHVGGEGGGYWQKAITIQNGTGAKVTDFLLLGRGPFYSGSVALEFTGLSTPLYVSRGDIEHFANGIRVLGDTEGVHISHVEIVEGLAGIELRTSMMGELGRPGTSIASCHTLTRRVGILLDAHSQVAIANNLIFRYSTDHTYTGIHLRNAGANRVTGNYIANAAADAAWNGIIIEGNSQDNVVLGNTIQGQAGVGVSTGIWLVSSGGNNNLVTGNIIRNYTYAPILNWGIGNHVALNLF